jgi:shikimate kinase
MQDSSSTAGPGAWAQAQSDAVCESAAEPSTEPERHRPPNRSIVLVGLMGVGKSSVGRRLALRLKLPFFDADDEIERAAGATIPEIFAKLGEPAFRDGERRVIRRLLGGPAAVIATGGGAFVDPDTRALVLETATAVWLQADIDVLVERTSRRDNRPLLKNGDPRTILTRLAAERAPAYAQAPIHVTSGRGPHEHTVEQILNALPAEPAPEPAP